MKRITGVLMMAALLLSSCIHKDLCMHHNDHAHKYHVMIDPEYRYEWEENCTGYKDWEAEWPTHFVDYDGLCPGKPAGLRVVNYPENGNSKISNISADGGIVYLSEGVHDILFYNNDTEYIVMASTEKFATTRATTRTRTRASYMGNPFDTKNDKEETVNPPDMLFGNFYNAYQAQKLPEPDVIEITLHPLVFTYKVRFEFEYGLQYVSLARGVLSGMAKSVNMSTGETSEETAAVLFDCEIKDYGPAAFVNSFGVPGYPNGNYTKAGNTHALNLEVRMRNGNLKSFDFDVTDQVEAQPHGGVIVVSGIRIEDEDGMTGSGAFDVTVNDWGEYEDIEIPLL